jgi:hypothetical protein
VNLSFNYGIETTCFRSIGFIQMASSFPPRCARLENFAAIDIGSWNGDCCFGDPRFWESLSTLTRSWCPSSFAILIQLFSLLVRHTKSSFTPLRVWAGHCLTVSLAVDFGAHLSRSFFHGCNKSLVVVTAESIVSMLDSRDDPSS